MGKNQIRGSQNEAARGSQHEDAVLKTSMQFFREELLPYLGVKEKIVGVAPTESVDLEIHKLYQDYNFVMESGDWLHFEFQSTNEGLKGLKRFRAYESNTSYQHEVNVTTYVLYSGNIKNPMTEFATGVNTYRVVPIIMRKKNVDELFAGLRKKLECGEVLTKKDVVPLILSPLMGGKMPQKERFLEAYRITQSVVDMEKSEAEKIEAVIYAMAEKFLEKAEKEQLKEEVRMTTLGQMLVNDGIEMGIQALVSACQELGILKNDVINQVVKNFQFSEEEAKENVEKYWE